EKWKQMQRRELVRAIALLPTLRFHISIKNIFMKLRHSILAWAGCALNPIYTLNPAQPSISV
ncbi:MAG: hypothetical protein PVH58_07800, partial [Desulfobacterales bacterium]